MTHWWSAADGRWGFISSTDFLLLIAIVTAVILLAWDINIPFVRGEDTIMYSLYARNILKYGAVATRLAPIELNPSVDEDLSRGIHNPSHITLLNIFLALSYKTFGFQEWAGRLVPILASLGTLAVVYILASALWNRQVAAIAAVIMALSPISIVNGRKIMPYPVQVFFSMLALLLYVLWLQGRKKRYLIASFGSLMLGMLSYWVGFLVPPFIAAHYLLFGKRRRFGFATAVLAFSLLVGLLVFLYTA